MIQSRYGWTDETVRHLPFSRFLGLIKLLTKAKQEREKEGFILAAFVGFQMGAGGKENFGEYLIRLGLSERKPMQVTKVDDTAALARMGIKVKKVKKFSR